MGWFEEREERAQDHLRIACHSPLLLSLPPSKKKGRTFLSSGEETLLILRVWWFGGRLGLRTGERERRREREGEKGPMQVDRFYGAPQGPPPPLTFIDLPASINQQLDRSNSTTTTLKAFHFQEKPSCRFTHARWKALGGSSTLCLAASSC